MKTIDLSRVPEAYRERVMRLVTAAREATIARCSADDVESAVQGAERDAVSPFLAIADKADATASRQYAATQAGGGYAPYDATPDGMHVVCKASADAAHARVWADEIAKLDAQRAPLGTPRAVEIATQAIVEDVGCDAEEAGSTAFAVIEALNGAGWDPIGGRPVFTGTMQTEARLTISDDNSLHMVLDAIARYLAEPRDGLPVELTLDVIRLLALSLPRGPLAPAEHEAHTLAALAALVKTTPGNRWPGSSPRLDLATWDPASVARVAALPKAHAFSMPYGEQMVDVAIANVDGLEVKAQHKRAMTDAERLGLGGGS